MEGRVSGGGGCCIAQYGHHHGPTQNYYNPYDASKMDRIMLRFRPIAPKPVPGGTTTTTTSTTTTTTTTTNDTSMSSRRGKKRNSAATGTGGKKKRKSCSPDDTNNNNNKKCDASSSNGCKVTVTLPLLPETPDLSPRKNNQVGLGQSKSSPEPMWLCFGSSDQTNQTAPDVVNSTVIIEGVSDTWVDGNSLGRTDEERKQMLEEDTCPGFISDAWNRVCWTNKAYGKMVTGDEDTWGKERVVMVKLGMREKVELPPVNLFAAFTCRVKVVYYSKQGVINGGGHSLTVPCDVWRMDGGGFAWRLDVKAALCLGR
ncbi:hypothetical protein SOVF_163620 [Spinacia oleracea]|uniref:DUF7950 domain-containing protein n=1 Tax=Spinacia oleracea TaxID=3562 RepID=A0A9R0JFU2_SPIOL|nr:uncharacterized protein LOC110805023 [Spinacia oleracea]KNA08323.1 hypothetical protein SOVF_163620 [Spinacia oleracea]